MQRAAGILFDIDGVLVVSWEPIDGAAQAVAAVRERDLPVRFVTNTTSLDRRAIVERLVAGGIEVAVDEVLTAPAATAAWVRSNRPGASCYLINSGDLGDDLHGVDVVDADAPADIVILGGAGPEFSYQQMNHALGLLLDGAELVGMHRNRYWRTAEGFSLDTGAYLGALESAADVTATVIGKPAPAFFRTAAADLAAPAGAPLVMVGDDLDNDVLAAQDVGMTGVLVRTGKYRPETEATATGAADHVIDSVADLPALLDRTDP